MLVPLVLTFMASGFGFAQCRQTLGEGYPRPSPTRQAGWELEESREEGDESGELCRRSRGEGRGRLAMKSGKGPWERGPLLTE